MWSRWICFSDCPLPALRARVGANRGSSAHGTCVMVVKVKRRTRAQGMGIQRYAGF